ncbi:MAG: class I SAM-dependent methyltransferase [Candidatus Bipolaricaulota bacterium]
MSEVVRRHYDGCYEREWERLGRPYRRLELVTTLHLIERYFPPEGRIADIGGGPGRYTAELLKRGYRVTLVDLAPRALEFAESKLAELGLVPEQVLCADACDLAALPDQAFDGCLCMGPLYHIVEPADRQRALCELRRVLKPGAPAIVAFLNPWGILRAGLSEFPEAFADHEHVRALLETWVQAGEQEAFTEAVFLTPPQILAELDQAGLALVSYAAAEGFATGMFDALGRMAEQAPEAYANVLRLAAETCELPQYRDCTEHLHAVVRA